MWEDTVSLISGQNRLKDDYKDTDMSPKVNKADIARHQREPQIMSWCCKSTSSINHCKPIKVQTYDDYSKCADPDDKMITSMLHLHPDKNKLFSNYD